jgi:hypothetical protein
MLTVAEALIFIDKLLEEEVVDECNASTTLTSLSLSTRFAVR